MNENHLKLTIQGLEEVLEQHRASLSVEEIEALEEAVQLLQQVETSKEGTSIKLLQEILPYIVWILKQIFLEE